VVLATVLFASLLVPTFLMGMSLPLLARTLTLRVEGAAGRIGSLYAFNTLGAAAGAFFTTWMLIRSLGFEATVYLGAALNLFAAVGAILVAPYFLGNRTLPEEASNRKTDPSRAATDSSMFPVPVWLAIYGLSGFVALSLEIVWFRLLGVMLKSTAFTFGNLLAIFLAGLAVGTFVGIKWVQRSRRPAMVFLALQAGIPIYAGASLLLLALSLENLTILEPLWRYLGSYEPLDIGSSLSALRHSLSSPHQFSLGAGNEAVQFLALYVVVPLALIGPPTLMMGLSFPFLQRVVQSDVAFLGRRVGWLQAANIFGSMLGAILTGWLLLRFLGTSGTIKALLLPGAFFLFLVINARQDTRAIPNLAAGGAATLAVLLLAWLIPDSSMLWARLHGTTAGNIIFAEDGSGLSVLKSDEAGFKGEVVVYANGLGQSSVPFASHHITLGLVPVMLHPNPKQIAVIGLGSGATPYALGGREETEQITCIEIVAPQLNTLQRLSRLKSYGGLQSLLEDDRITYTFADGRAVLRLDGKKYDIIEADALRPTSAYAGNLYSTQYFELLKDHLKPGGFAVSWAPTPRVIDTFVKVFPYAMLYKADVEMLIGSNQPLEWNGAEMGARLSSDFSKSYYARAGIPIEPYLQSFREQKPIVFSPHFDRTKLQDVNSDLFPKDEYLVPSREPSRGSRTGLIPESSSTTQARAR
jgi:predicted membrane-bound spermidine synthase